MTKKKLNLAALNKPSDRPNPADRYKNILESEDIKYYPEAFISPQYLKPHPQNEKIYTLESLEELAEDFLKYGLYQPILVHEIGDNEYRILAGHRRFAAMQLVLQRRPGALNKGINCKIVPRSVSEMDSEIMLIHANALNREQSEETKRKEVRRLQELYKQKEEAGDPINQKLHEFLAKNLNIKPRQAYKLIAVEKLIPKLYELYQKNKFDINTAASIAAMDTDVQEMVYDYCITMEETIDFPSFVKHMKNQSDHYQAALAEHETAIKKLNQEINSEKDRLNLIETQMESIPKPEAADADPAVINALNTLNEYKKKTKASVEKKEKELNSQKEKKPKPNEFFNSAEVEQKNIEVKNSISAGKEWIRVLTSNIGKYNLSPAQLKELKHLRTQLDRAIAAQEGADDSNAQ